jgi:hypothetical protein
VRISKVEILFVVVPITAVGAIIFSLADAPKEVGAKLNGQIRQCSGSRKLGTRRCIVDVDSHTSVEIDASFGRAGIPVTVVKMHKALSGATYYVATTSGDP